MIRNEVFLPPPRGKLGLDFGCRSDVLWSESMSFPLTAGGMTKLRLLNAESAMWEYAELREGEIGKADGILIAISRD